MNENAFKSTYANKHALDLYSRISSPKHREWLLAVINLIQDYFPKADHYCIPSHSSLLIKVGRYELGSTSRHPVFHIYLEKKRLGFNVSLGSTVLKKLHQHIYQEQFDRKRSIY